MRLEIYVYLRGYEKFGENINNNQKNNFSKHYKNKVRKKKPTI